MKMVKVFLRFELKRKISPGRPRWPAVKATRRGFGVQIRSIKDTPFLGGRNPCGYSAQSARRCKPDETVGQILETHSWLGPAPGRGKKDRPDHRRFYRGRGSQDVREMLRGMGTERRSQRPTVSLKQAAEATAIRRARIVEMAMLFNSQRGQPPPRISDTAVTNRTPAAPN